METKRLRPVTYAESLVAKKYAEDNETNTIEKDDQKIEIKQESSTTVNSVKIKDLPSGGQSYPDNSEIYFTPLSFGEMKFLSGSSLSDPESITFFLKKIQCTFPKEDLTYYDFYFITVMIKMATFGDVEYNMTFECNECGHINKQPFNITDLEFEEIRVPIPIGIDLKVPFKSTEEGKERTQVIFIPISIGRYKKMIESNAIEDYDLYMANCIKEGSEEDRLKIIKEYMNGSDVNLLETIDVSMYHGVKDIKMKCNNKIEIKIETKDEKDEEKIETEGQISKEVCGREFDIPFHDLSEFIATTDKLKESLGKRIHFGI